jgi:hypothetical protein
MTNIESETTRITIACILLLIVCALLFIAWVLLYIEQKKFQKAVEAQNKKQETEEGVFKIEGEGMGREHEGSRV